MHAVEDLSRRMRAAGMRVTPQRQAIAEHLIGNTAHPTVEAIHDAVRAAMPTVSLKTVYQTVHDLEALGEVRLLDLGTGAVRVDPNVEDEHHHLVCTRCGAVRDVMPDLATSIARRERRDFTITAVEVIFRGHCDTCS
jgi:Fur family transcriptional regulator, stress-responsive regulator